MQTMNIILSPAQFKRLRARAHKISDAIEVSLFIIEKSERFRFLKTQVFLQSRTLWCILVMRSYNKCNLNRGTAVEKRFRAACGGEAG